MEGAAHIDDRAGAIDVNLIRPCDAILPPCRAIRYSRAKVVPGVPISNIQFDTYINYARIYKSHKKMQTYTLCCTLYTKPVQQYAEETFIVFPRYAHYIKGKLVESISKISGQNCFSIVYGVCVMRLMCAPDSFLWDENIFYMRSIFPCSFAQID